MPSKRRHANHFSLTHSRIHSCRLSESECRNSRSVKLVPLRRNQDMSITGRDRVLQRWNKLSSIRSEPVRKTQTKNSKSMRLIITVHMTRMNVSIVNNGLKIDLCCCGHLRVLKIIGAGLQRKYHLVHSQ